MIHRCLLSLLLILTAGVASQAASPDGPPTTQPAPATLPPHVVLTNGRLTLYILTPDPATMLTDTRFDWSGRVVLAEYDGHTFFGSRRLDAQGNSTLRFHRGTTDEFKTSLDILTSDTPATQPAVAPNNGPTVARRLRIGVGVLEPRTKGEGKSAKTVWVNVKPLAWDVTQEEAQVSSPAGIDQTGPMRVQRLRFHQTCNEGPWGYELDKVIELPIQPAAAQFTIRRTFKNTGRTTIDTLHYCHNWTLIDGQYVSDQYRLTFNFVPQPVTLKDPRKGKTPPTFAGRSILTGPGFWSELGPQTRVADNDVLMENIRTGGQMRLTGDWKPDAFNIYVQAGECCPEPFIHLVLKPGESRTWTSTYTFTSAVPGNPPATPLKP